MKNLPRFSSIVLSLCFAFSTYAQQPCTPPAIPQTKEPNIFTPQQEMDLGDAIAEQVQKDYRVIDDDEASAYLRQIGDRIVKGLPQTGIKFQFFVVDLPEANAFTLPGGRIYVTRKLIAFARTEDELAGVIAHELGHGLMHHAAVDLTRVFRATLGVTQVTDRRDIFEKYNQLIETARHKGVRDRDHQEDQQLEADRAGLYAMMAAGYDPQAFSSFWDRFVEAKGKTGSWFSDLFGTTKPEQKRLREIIRAAAGVPAECVAKRDGHTVEDFKKWQAAVVVYSGTGRREQIHSLLSKTTLAPPLRGEITHIRFSPDGKYVLAQDDSGINVLARDPFALLFRIEAPEAKPAVFSPDSQSIVVHYSSLRVERWNPSDGTKISVNEVVMTRTSCLQVAVSSDGKTAACFDTGFDLNLFNVATSELLYEKKAFYRPQSFFEYLMLFLALNSGSDVAILNMQFSPDNRYLLAARSENERIIFSFDGMASGTEKVATAIDLTTRKPISLGGNVKSLMSGGFTFYSPTAIVGEYFRDQDNSGIYSFPDGKKVDQLKLAGTSFTMAQSGDYFVIRPISGYPAGVYDVKARKIIVANKQAAIDVYGNTFVAERRNGEIGLYDLATLKPLTLVTLPRNSLGTLRVAEVSPDLKWLAVSERSRGAVWELNSGQRVFHIRGFRGAHFGNDGNIYADFPKYEKQARTIARMMPEAQDVAEGFTLPDEGLVKQYGGYVINMASPEEKSEKAKPKKEKKEDEGDAADESSGKADDTVDVESPILIDTEYVRPGQKNVNMEVRDAQEGRTLWTRNFAEGAPQYWGNQQHGTLTMAWSLSSKAARSIVKTDTGLSQRLSALGDKEGDYLVQAVQIESGKPLGQLLIETGKGAFRVKQIITAGDWVVVSDTENRVLVYSLSSGQLKQRFFGGRVAVSSRDNLLCVENDRGQLLIYDLASGQKRDEFSFSSAISLIQFAEGKRLFVLTANQTAYLFDLSAQKPT
jgi:WD40 repeat protein